VYVAGHRGLAGSAVVRALTAHGVGDIIGWSSAELDLTDREATLDAIVGAKPDVVVMAAARVGGIMANDSGPVEFLADNVRIQTNVFEAAHTAGVDRLLFLSSSCVYPKHAPQPMRPEHLLTGHLEPTNDAYAIAKLAGMLHVQAYRRQHHRRWISCLPTNLYGPGDGFDPATSHVLPALIRRFHDAARSGAESVTLWGTGTPRREFLHVDDLARACVHLLEHYDDPAPINVGVGTDLTIADLARLVADAAGYEGAIAFDPTKPDGTPRKLLDVDPIHALGWQATIPLDQGIAQTLAWYVQRRAEP
jgi:GDP-L-fucose synthase